MCSLFFCARSRGSCLVFARSRASCLVLIHSCLSLIQCHVHTFRSNSKKSIDFSTGKVGYPWESTQDLYQHIPPIYGLYNGCIGQYGVMFWEHLLGYPPKGTQIFPHQYLGPGSYQGSSVRSPHRSAQHSQS